MLFKSFLRTKIPKPSMSNPIKILIVGSSFGGISAMKSIMRLAPSVSRKIQVNVVDPRSGFINVLAIPKFISDTQLASKWYCPLENFGVPWSSVWSNKDEKPKKILNDVTTQKNIEFNYIQGYATELRLEKLLIRRNKYLKRNCPSEFSKTITAEKNSDYSEIPYDYCILASGRSRNWPFDPILDTKNEFLSEMAKISSIINSKKRITVIGGGGLGIEVAGQLKESFPEKHIQLIHPYQTLPPEPLLANSFKTEMENQIKESGIELLLNTRIAKTIVLNNGEVSLQTTDGRNIITDLDMWCNYHYNNIQYLYENFSHSLVKKDEVSVNKCFQMTNKLQNTPYENIFAIGDLAALGLIKKAGLARNNAEFAVSNIFALIKNDKNSMKEFNGIKFNNMAIPIGSKRNVACLNGKVLVNSPGIADKYQDYKCKGVALKLGLNIPETS